MATALTVPAVYEAIAAVTAEMAKEGIAKGRRNQQQGYQFRGIDDVYNALSPILAKHRLCILPRVLRRDVVERETQRGGVLFSVTIEAEFDFVSANDGSVHVIRTFGEAMDSADKATNKAMSAAYKYAAMQAFCIPTEGDNDTDAHTPDPAPRRETARDRAQREADANGGIHPNNEPDDFDAAAAALALQADMKCARDKAALGMVWNGSKPTRALIKRADPAIYEALSKTLADETARIEAADNRGSDILDDEVPY